MVQHKACMGGVEESTERNQRSRKRCRCFTAETHVRWRWEVSTETSQGVSEYAGVSPCTRARIATETKRRHLEGGAALPDDALCAAWCVFPLHARLKTWASYSYIIHLQKRGFGHGTFWNTPTQRTSNTEKGVGQFIVQGGCSRGSCRGHRGGAVASAKSAIICNIPQCTAQCSECGSWYRP